MMRKRAKPYDLALHKLARGYKQTMMRKKAKPFELDTFGAQHR